MSQWSTIAGTLVLGCALYLGKRAISNQNSHPLPPGPPGLPWAGNVIGIDLRAPWKTYAEWAKTYGDIVYSRLMGKDIIIINSEKIARDLLEKRSGNYSDRPQLVATEMLGLGFHTPLLPYSDRWRLHRRFFNQTFRPDAMPRFKQLQYRKSCHLLRQLFSHPEQLQDHLFEYTASFSLNSTYAYNPVSRKDDMVDTMANVLEVVVPAIRPDIAILASTFSFLLCLPSWFPGMSFKKEIEMAHAASKVYVPRLFECALQKAEMSSDSVAPSLVHDGLQNKDEEDGLTWMVALKEAAAASFVAASAASSSVLLTVFLFLMLNPSVQEKAQAQIDAVVGKNRLPSIEDRPLLPLIDALLRETLRHCPIVPLLIPHQSMNDDVYEGFHIPKGAILLANAWSMAHDESRYPNSDAFIPERFLNDDGSLKPNDLEHVMFGFGRRMCPGKHFADASVWGVLARVLAVFKILKPLDEHGIEITIKPQFSSGLIIHPLPFDCRIVPRSPRMDSEQLEELIAASSA